MNVITFMNTLLSNPEKPIIYNVDNEFTIEPHIHMTEIKNHVIESVDCGGTKNNWNETVMQLWTGVKHDDGHRLDSSKLLSILKMVETTSELDVNSELLIEYGNKHNRVANYSLELQTIDDDSLQFKLLNSTSQCKGMSEESSCCAPKETNCCSSPESNCCA